MPDTEGRAWTLGLGYAAWGWSATSRCSATPRSTPRSCPSSRTSTSRSSACRSAPAASCCEAIAALRAASRVRARTVRAAPPEAHPAPGAERRQLTVMFVDLVGSTALSARLDPEEMGEVLRAYQNAVAGEVARFEGHVAKFMGDGVLAYFGWPRAHEDEAERAVRAGLAVAAAVRGLRCADGEPLAARVGIATGLVVVGELIGEGAAQEEAVVGETPNLAARLQALAEPGTVVVARRPPAGCWAACSSSRTLGPRHAQGLRRRRSRASRVVRASGRRRAGSRPGDGPALAPMVGRDQELALLLERWRQAKAGEGQGVLLVGEAGIGKSRIVQRARSTRSADEPHVRLRYQCSPYHADSALWPVIQQLDARGRPRRPRTRPSEQLDKLEALLAAAGDRPTAHARR